MKVRDLDEQEHAKLKLFSQTNLDAKRPINTENWRLQRKKHKARGLT